MFQERDSRRDIFALGMLVGVTFLTLALLTYDPADPPVELVYPLNQVYHQDIVTYPVHQQTSNACGPGGALAASVLVDVFGVGAYYLMASLVTVTVLLLRRHEVDSPIIRCIGWTMSLVGLCAFATIMIPNWTPGPVLGAGGYLGALVATVLRMNFGSVGAFLLATSMIFGGLLLCTDYVLVHLGLFVGAMTMATLTGRRRPAVALPSDGDSEAPRLEEPAIVSVRVGGRKVAMAAGEMEEAVADSADAEYEEDGEYEEGDYEDGEYEEGDYEDGEHEDGEYEEGEAEEDADEEDADEDALPVKLPASIAKKAAAKATAAAGSMAARRGRRRLAALRIARPPEPNRDEVMDELDAAADLPGDCDYALPSINLLSPSASFCFDKQAKEVRRKAKVLEQTFQNFGFNVKVVEIETGPVIAQYEVELEKGLRLAKITNLADDLAIALRVPSVRIVAPIPGKNTVGIEVPNEDRQLVQLRDVMEESVDKTNKMKIPIFLGKDVSGNAMTVDLATMPHLLIAGRTGTGKSVCLNAIISSMLMTRRPDEVRMLMIDPKMVELSGYRTLPHLMHPVVTDMRKAEAILAWAVEKMEERYQLLAKAGVRQLSSYNQLGREELLSRIETATDEEAAAIPTNMPYIVIVADEIADMMMTAGKDVEQHIIRLAQKSRAVGIHLILATQKPTVDVITGLIKSNLPARLAFQVASRTDSRVVLDENGADRLLGNGDMLFLWPGTSTLMRGQGTFVGDDEINAIVEAASTGEQHFVKELVQMKVADENSSEVPESLKKRDDLYERAIEVVVSEGRGSVSLLQRALGVGYGRGARMIDFMAEDGIVGAYAGSQAREVLVTMEDVRRMTAGDGGDTEETEPDDDAGRAREPKRAPKTKRMRAKSTKAKGTASAPRNRRSGPEGSMPAPSADEAVARAIAAAELAETEDSTARAAANSTRQDAPCATKPTKPTKPTENLSATQPVTGTPVSSGKSVSTVPEGKKVILQENALLDDPIREAFTHSLNGAIEDVDAIRDAEPYDDESYECESEEYDVDESDLEDGIEDPVDAELEDREEDEYEYVYEDEAEGELEDGDEYEYEYVYEDAEANAEDGDLEAADDDDEYEYAYEYEDGEHEDDDNERGEWEEEREDELETTG